MQSRRPQLDRHAVHPSSPSLTGPPSSSFTVDFIVLLCFSSLLFSTIACTLALFRRINLLSAIAKITPATNRGDARYTEPDALRQQALPNGELNAL